MSCTIFNYCTTICENKAAVTMYERAKLREKNEKADQVLQEFLDEG